MQITQTVDVALSAHRRRYGWRLLGALLLGAILGVALVLVDLMPLGWRVGCVAAIALLVSLPSVVLGAEHVPGSAHARGTLGALLTLDGLAGAMSLALGLVPAAVQEPLAGMLVPLLLALVCGYVFGVGARNFSGTWALASGVGFAAWLGPILVQVVRAAITAVSAGSGSSLPTVLLATLLGVMTSAALGLPFAVAGALFGALLRVRPIARMGCPDHEPA